MKSLKYLERVAKSRLTDDKTGHDYVHVKRTLSNALTIAENEKNVNIDILKAACLMHDISMSDGISQDHHKKSAKQSIPYLKKAGFSSNEIIQIQHAILNHYASFSGEKLDKNLSKEAKILFDADRLDGLGATGLIRMIQFSTRQGVPYFKSINDVFDETFYGNIKYMTKLGNSMLTKSGKKLAEKRILIMKQFLNNLKKEL